MIPFSSGSSHNKGDRYLKIATDGNRWERSMVEKRIRAMEKLLRYEYLHCRNHLVLRLFSELREITNFTKQSITYPSHFKAQRSLFQEPESIYDQFQFVWLPAYAEIFTEEFFAGRLFQELNTMARTLAVTGHAAIPRSTRAPLCLAHGRPALAAHPIPWSPILFALLIQTTEGMHPILTGLAIWKVAAPTWNLHFPVTPLQSFP